MNITYRLSFLSAIALAGMAFLLGNLLVKQSIILSYVSWLNENLLPVIVIGYLLGAVFRLMFE